MGSNVLAGTLNHGIYRSTDFGTNWIQTSFDSQNIYAFVSNSSYVFAGTNGQGIYLSGNSGMNWVYAGLNDQFIYSLAANGSIIFAGTYFNHGIYKSTDNGTSWTQTTLDNQNIYSLVISGNNIFAGTGPYPYANGVYISNDNGANWVQRNEGLNSNLFIHSLCIMNNYIYAGTDGSGVYRRPINELIGIQPISTEVPSIFSLSQNFPNPFNPGTKIRFEISTSKVGTGEMTRLTIYDVFGRELETLVNENLKAGTYEVCFDAGKYSSGVYFYKLMTNDFSSSRKMILVK